MDVSGTSIQVVRVSGSRLPTATIGYRNWIATEQETRRNSESLKASGWEVMAVWECELRDLDSVAERLVTFIEAPPNIDEPHLTSGTV